MLARTVFAHRVVRAFALAASLALAACTFKTMPVGLDGLAGEPTDAAAPQPPNDGGLPPDLSVVPTPSPSPSPSPTPPPGDMGSPSKVSKLWILNQGGADLTDLFDCLLRYTNWNDRATAYAGALPMVLGAQKLISSHYPCPQTSAQAGSQSYYQCAVDAGHFDVADGDVLLVVRPDTGTGGLDNSNSTDPTHGMQVTNPNTHATVTVSAAHVGQTGITVYAVHEVFEAQTDLISADCCNGESAPGGGGLLPWCPDCGPASGVCDQYAENGTYGITTITCPSSATYRIQTVSPPGAHQYGSPEFNGTCQSFDQKAGAWSCDFSAYQGRQYWTCWGGVLNKCDSSGHPIEQSCNGKGCRSNSPGTDDACN